MKQTNENVTYLLFSLQPGAFSAPYLLCVFVCLTFVFFLTHQVCPILILTHRESIKPSNQQPCILSAKGKIHYFQILYGFITLLCLVDLLFLVVFLFNFLFVCVYFVFCFCQVLFYSVGTLFHVDLFCFWLIVFLLVYYNY